ncbi:MAG: 5-(carboxyamino)imidazole ribonucleotide synthase [Sphingomicrobium sp.]
MSIPPGSTIGIIGGGQLGRMLAMAAARLGYRVHIFAPDEQPVGADVAAAFTRADYGDERALGEFASAVDVATYEFENLPAAPLALLGAKLRPGVRSLCVAQDRAEEKSFIERCGGVVAPWRAVESLADVESAVLALGLPLVLKTRRLGYDGKGQAWIRSAAEVAEAWRSIGEQPAVAEAGMDFEAEFSVILARTDEGKMTFWDSPDNRHEDGILRRSTLPAGPEIEALVERAREMAAAIAEALDHVGVLTVEYFACADGPIVNEIAPRVHNSGHWTIEGAETSQFEQHIRAICGLPLGPTRRTGNVIEMRNLIGDDINEWLAPLEEGLHLHIYGKGAPRPGRKMGHVTRVAERT